MLANSSKKKQLICRGN